MEERFIKPGNQERGWNDPPQFSYGLQKAGGTKRTLLTRRAPPPQETGQGAPPTVTPFPSHMTPPPSHMTPPPSHMTPPPFGLTPPFPHKDRPPGLMTSSPTPCVDTPPSRPEPIRDENQSEREADVEEVMSELKGALSVCRQAVAAQVYDDIIKRLCVLEEKWKTGKLSVCVRRRMTSLVQEMKSGRWDSADEIHRSLMVDHVTEVSQWMVGVKRLIAETRNHRPDPSALVLSDPVQSDPVQSGAVQSDPVQSSPVQSGLAQSGQEQSDPL